jgi:hypothetical protein
VVECGSLFHLGTKTCLRCMPAPATHLRGSTVLTTVRWDSLLAPQGQLPARVNGARH